MTVRLAFAVAAHLEPDILVVDEVLAVGDAEFQKKAIGKMQEISGGEGRTVLFVSHNMDSVRRLCKTGILIENGKIVLKGTSDQVVDEYLSRSIERSSVSLENRTDRTGSGAIIGTKIELINNESNSVVPEIVSGMSVSIRVHYKVNDLDLIGEEVNVGLTILNQNGVFITVLNNKMANYQLFIQKEIGYFDCVLEKVPFTLGEFSVDFNFQLMKTRFFLDRVESAYIFNVHDGDYYSSGTKNANGRQGIYIDQIWK